MSEKLAACPFCGGKAEIVQSHNPYVICSVCHASTPMFSWKADAVAAWNRRAENAECGWISVKERMPETEETMAVICRRKDGKVSWNRAWWDGQFWHGSGSFADVTHWMPISMEVQE